MDSAHAGPASGTAMTSVPTPAPGARSSWIGRVVNDRPLAHQLRIGFGVVLLVLLIDSAFALRSTIAVQQASDRVTQTYAAINLAQNALNDLVDMETGYRGFLLTGDDTFLEPYTTGHQQFEEDIAQLESTAADNADRASRWQDLDRRAAAWQAAVTEPSIAMRRGVNSGSAQMSDLINVVASSQGKQMFDAIRSAVASAQAADAIVLEQRTQDATLANQVLLLVLCLGVVLGLGLAGCAALLIERSIVGGVGQLARAAQRIADGDLDSRIGIRRRDEVGVAATGFDRMADHLQAAMERTESILDSAGEGIIGYDEDDRIAFANPAAAMMLGYAPAELVGLPGHSTLHHSRADGSPYPSEECPIHTLADGAIRRKNEVLWRKNRTPMPVEYVATPLRTARGRGGVVLVFLDITERLQADEERRQITRELVRQQTELERSNRELQDFASVASHDLQEPLRKVQAFADRLERKYASQLEGDGLDYLSRMQDAAGRMRTLISDLLTFSRVTTQSQPLVEIDLQRVVVDVIGDMEVAIERSGARVELGTLPTLEADSLQMRQLFQNLISNALKFRKPDETPCVRICSEQREGTPDDSSSWNPASGDEATIWHEIRVQDNGIGFEEKYLDRIFTIFQRLHGRGAYEGTGVGLAVCRKIVDRHGGTITAHSEPDRGATFIVTLPATHERRTDA
jgi:PAS domain S-box-containing protein